MDRLPTPEGPVPPPEAVFRKIRAGATEPSPKRYVRSPLGRWSVGAVAILGVFALAVAALPSAGAFQWTLAAGGAGLAAVAVLLSLGRGRAGAASRWGAALGAGPLFVAAVWLTRRGTGWSPPVGAPVAPLPFFSTAWDCFAMAASISALPLLAMGWMWRRTDPFTPRLSGAVIGVWAGLVGAVGVTLSCPNLEWSHTLLGHGGALLAGAAAGLLAGRRVLCP